MHLSICKFTQTFRGVLEELPNFLKLDNDRQNSTKSKLTGNPKPCYNEKIYSDKFIITMCLFSPNGNTASKKDVSASLQKRPFSLYQMRKTPIFLRICQPLLLLLQIQQLLRLLPMPIKPIISTCAGTEEEPANCASECIRPMVSVIP